MSIEREKVEALLANAVRLRPSNDPLAWMEEFALTTTEAEQIADPEWVEPGFIVEGHVVAIVAPPNGGKTTILFDLACSWARTHTVVYVDADTNPSDAKYRLARAQRRGVRYLTPDLKVGKSMRDVVTHLERMAASDIDLTRQVWIFDTLKRMANVIHKDSLKGLLALMRKLSGRGMTCILIGHTNKYRNSEGELQYEGTGDLAADVDELIYFEPRENPDGSLTVSTRCAKRRANIDAITWDILPDRTVVRRPEYVDVAAEIADAAQREKDQTVIEAITEALSDGPKKQIEIVTYCRELRLADKRVRAVLKRYSGRLWKAEPLFERNAWRYELL